MGEKESNKAGEHELANNTWQEGGSIKGRFYHAIKNTIFPRSGQTLALQFNGSAMD